MKTVHELIFGDAYRVLQGFDNNTVHLVVTSPPYWNARDYEHPDQIGYRDDLITFFNRLQLVWKEVIRILCNDGKLAVNIGNIFFKSCEGERVETINLSLLLWSQLNNYPNLDYMGTIYWKKSVSRNSAVLFGSYPYPSNFMISTALEPIHVFRKKGKRKVSKSIKEKSKISLREFRIYREPVWTINGTSHKLHPAIFPLEIPYRLIKLYSFVSDTVLDPFCGLANTNLAAIRLKRSSIGIDINSSYVKYAYELLKRESNGNPNTNILFNKSVDKYESEKKSSLPR